MLKHENGVFPYLAVDLSLCKKFALTMFKAFPLAMLYHTAIFPGVVGQFGRSSPATQVPCSIKLPAPAQCVYRQARQHPWPERMHTSRHPAQV